MRARRRVQVLLFGVLSLLILGPRPGEPARRVATVEDLLNLEVRPSAIAHRGFGENLGEDPLRPIENTLRAVRAGFKAGVSVVEVDVQLTSDGQVAVFHDDFLPDFTCVNQLTLAELQDRLPEVPTLLAVLNEARSFNDPGVLSGLVIVELKSAAPLCDPGDIQEQAFVSAVTGVIRHVRMTDQVMLTSFSPALLYLAASEAPEVTRILSISGLQFLTALEIETLLGLPVTLIDKNPDFGLQWAEIGPLFRLPGYRSVAEVLSTAAVTGVRVVEADLFFLSTAGAPFVDLLHGFGLKVLGFTANEATEWFFLQSLGVDGIYTNNVPFGVENQAPLPWRHPFHSRHTSDR
jgi:glycerophosphoryl diester phosphodiesterase